MDDGGIFGGGGGDVRDGMGVVFDPPQWER